MGRLGNAAAARVIDARGLHRVARLHRRALARRRQGLEGALKEARQLIAQGITTVALNPDGGGTPDLRDAARRLRAARRRRQRRALRAARRDPPRGARHGRSRADAGRARSHDGDREERDGGRRHRPVVRPLLRAGQLREDRGGDRARQGRRRDGRRLREPHPRRGRLQHRRRRRGAGSDSHRRRRPPPGHRRAHESARPGELGAVDGAGRAHQAGARSRRRGLRRSVSLRRQRHRHRRRADSAMGRGRRTRGAAQADPGRGTRSPGCRHPPQLRAARRAGQAGDLALRAEPGLRGSVAGAGREGDRQAGRTRRRWSCWSRATPAWCRST